MAIVEELRQQLAARIRQALARAREQGEISFNSVPEVVLEVPREKAHGDFATNIAMAMARSAKTNPRKLAELIVRYINREGLFIDKIEIAGPGFINFYLSPDWLAGIIPAVRREDDNYGRTNKGQGRKVQVEFVSANPTGPMHMGNARGAALGDSLAAVLDFAGYDVTKEFYINDAGNQIEKFGLSLEARYLQELGHDVPFPEDGYHGEDIIDRAKEFIAIHGDKFVNVPAEERRRALVEYGLEKNLSIIKNTLASFGVSFDVWFPESTLHAQGKVTETIRLLEQRGLIYEKDGAKWFKSTAFGADKDDVVVRQNGIPTYFAADLAYHRDKFERGFQWIINIWGQDHHGHVARMKGAMAALGYDADRLDVILMQLVRIIRGGEVVRMSKRSGKAITLSDLIEEVGKDAARYFFVARGADSHCDFDLDLAVSQSSENPVFYVQYAHARICSILRQAAEAGVTLPEIDHTPVQLLTTEAERDLLRKLADFPGEVAFAAEVKEPHRLTKYAHDLATLFHGFYTQCRVLGVEPELSAARLGLVDATRIVLRNCLKLLGISAPERM